MLLLLLITRPAELGEEGRLRLGLHYLNAVINTKTAAAA